jgi:hypothetical protein
VVEVNELADFLIVDNDGNFINVYAVAYGFLLAELWMFLGVSLLLFCKKVNEFGD